MLSVIVFKWSSPGYRSKYGAEQVNIMRNMVARHYKKTHRFICITDDPEGICPDIEIHKIWDDYSRVPNPSWANGPSCYRRLKVFSEWFREIAGERFICLDLDAVIVGDLSPIFDHPGDCVTYSCPGLGGNINGALFMLTTGSRQFVWDLFDPNKSPQETVKWGFKGSDQGWLSACLRHCSDHWPESAGIYSYKNIYKERRKVIRGKVQIVPGKKSRLPDDARIILFHGKPDPWEIEATSRSPWILENYR